MICEQEPAADATGIEFSEGIASKWWPIPRWIRFFLDLGIRWPYDGKRRICIVSTPCDSAAAGLIALGAMLRRLSQSGANDLDDHIRRLRNLRPDPRVILRRVWDKHQYIADPVDKDGSIWFRRVRDGQRHRFLEYHAGEWYFEAEAPIELKGGEVIPWRSHYAALLASDATLLPSNLGTSDSSIVLAGRSTGRSAQEAILAGLRFASGGHVATLQDLLTLESSHRKRFVARIRYLNTRTSEESTVTRTGIEPRLVIADGGDALRFAVESNGFAGTTIVGHIPRTDDQGRLEEVANTLSGLRSWYAHDADIESELPVAPPGVVVRTFGMRE